MPHIPDSSVDSSGTARHSFAADDSGLNMARRFLDGMASKELQYKKSSAAEVDDAAKLDVEVPLLQYQPNLIPMLQRDIFIPDIESEQSVVAAAANNGVGEDTIVDDLAALNFDDDRSSSPGEAYDPSVVDSGDAHYGSGVGQKWELPRAYDGAVVEVQARHGADTEDGGEAMRPESYFSGLQKSAIPTKSDNSDIAAKIEAQDWHNLDIEVEIDATILPGAASIDLHQAASKDVVVDDFGAAAKVEEKAGYKPDGKIVASAQNFDSGDLHELTSVEIELINSIGIVNDSQGQAMPPQHSPTSPYVPLLAVAIAIGALVAIAVSPNLLYSAHSSSQRTADETLADVAVSMASRVAKFLELGQQELSDWFTGAAVDAALQNVDIVAVDSLVATANQSAAATLVELGERLAGDWYIDAVAENPSEIVSAGEPQLAANSAGLVSAGEPQLAANSAGLVSAGEPQLAANSAGPVSAGEPQLASDSTDGILGATEQNIFHGGKAGESVVTGQDVALVATNESFEDVLLERTVDVNWSVLKKLESPQPARGATDQPIYTVHGTDGGLSFSNADAVGEAALLPWWHPTSVWRHSAPPNVAATEDFDSPLQGASQSPSSRPAPLLSEVSSPAPARLLGLGELSPLVLKKSKDTVANNLL